jgi:hypothetical protein
MAAKEMWDFLSASPVTADYTAATFDVHPQAVLIEDGTKDQVINEADDGSEERISLSDDSIFYVTMQWAKISESDAGIIMDYWHDPAKANGIAKSFYWAHPKDTHTYTARFNSKLSRGISAANYQQVDQISLKILGRAPV